MKVINPEQVKFISFDNILRWAQSVYKSLNGGISFGEPYSKDTAGNYNKWHTDNGNGILTRIGASTSTETNKWATANAQVTINHKLRRQPTGFIVCDLDASANIFRVGVPTVDTIVLQTSNVAANCTVYIF